ncbi:hypothetical protein H696_04229 [Fonticula alba]|uniref:CHCH domain-containing protein n=1 Tax=Fonticula alba TaxID=691883 RepID=A0A058Z5K6_FONAL|nr:hypothetical protein H696_04229 [Fonticula alba]KCV68812.1 hypothetical protein H696_04229 [Fonticula alba]|eukprot:XP_009496383.1 hypothetical protein H696_04229 [Fonticula alba]
MQPAPLPTPEDDTPDEYDARIARTGCSELNDQVLICYADHRDWRVCAPLVKAFRDCYERHERARIAEGDPLAIATAQEPGSLLSTSGASS